MSEEQAKETIGAGGGGGGGYQGYSASGGNSGSYDGRMDSNRYMQSLNAGAGLSNSGADGAWLFDEDVIHDQLLASLDWYSQRATLPERSWDFVF